MYTDSDITVGPSVGRLLLGLIWLPIKVGLITALLIFFCPSKLFIWIGITVAMLVAAIVTTLLIVVVAQNKPRIQITAQGFTYVPLIGAPEVYQWNDIHGDFAIRRWRGSRVSPGGEAVVFALADKYKKEHGITGTPIIENYDSLLLGDFQVSNEELCGLLNANKRKATAQ